MLTEPQAWREIARRIVEGEWRRDGLCTEVTRLWAEGRIACTRDTAMCDRIRLHTRDKGDAYLAPPGTEPEARALFALLMAEIVEDKSHA